jgi:transposase-like protein
MARRPKRTFTREFKAKVALDALDALKEHKTLEQLSQEYELTQSQISAWKKMARLCSPKFLARIPKSWLSSKNR